MSRSFFEILGWVVKEAASAVAQEVRDSAAAASNKLSIYIENPREAYDDIKAWASENKLTCTLLVGGAVIIVVPLAVGFAPGGIVGGSLAAAWQSSIGSVVAGSLFSILQSWGMTWTFVTLGGWVMGIGGLKLLAGPLWKSMSRMLEGFMLNLNLDLLTGPTGRGSLGAPSDVEDIDGDEDMNEDEGHTDESADEDEAEEHTDELADEDEERDGDEGNDEAYYWNGSTDEEYDSDDSGDPDLNGEEAEEHADKERDGDEGNNEAYYWNGSTDEEYDSDDFDGSNLNGEEW